MASVYTVLHNSKFIEFDRALMMVEEATINGDDLRPVAFVWATSTQEAYRLTNSIHNYWQDNEEVQVLIPRARSTSVGDVIVGSLGPQVVTSFGFEPLSKFLAHDLNDEENFCPKCGSHFFTHDNGCPED